jgi:hypothetical protein
MMTFRVFIGPRGAPMFSPVDRGRMLFKSFPNIDEALAWARHIASEGRVALLIEGDDGTHLDRASIAAALGEMRDTPKRDDFAT